MSKFPKYLITFFGLLILMLSAPSITFGQELVPSTAGDLYGQALSINNQGIVLIVGSSTQDGQAHPIFWKDGVTTDIPNNFGGTVDIKSTNSLNDHNEFVGTVMDDTFKIKGFIFKTDGIIEYLTNTGLLSDATSVEAVAINNNSQVLGTFKTGDLQNKIFLWQGGNYRIIEVPELNGEVTVYDINDSGVITGYVKYANQLQRAFALNTSADPVTFTEITSNGGGYDNIEPRSVNNNGQVVGSARYGGEMGASTAFTWVGGNFTALGTLPGGSISTAYSINSSGQIVGQSSTLSGEFHAFQYQNGLMTDLGKLSHDDTSGLVSNGSTSLCINDAGAIVGTNTSQIGSDTMTKIEHPIIFNYEETTPTETTKCKKAPKKIKKDKDLPPPFEEYCEE